MHVNARALIERTDNGEIHLLVQMRDKPYEGRALTELPGRRVEEFELLVEALRREVREETGLDLPYIEGERARIETNGVDTNVECIQPFAAYQTLRGPVDSMGIYFLCRAEGKLLESGDETQLPRWMPVSEIARLIDGDPEQFSFVDRAGLLFYLKNSLVALETDLDGSRRTLVGDVSLGPRLTLYTALGDIPGWIALAGFVFFMFFQFMIERRARKAAASTFGAGVPNGG